MSTCNLIYHVVEFGMDDPEVMKVWAPPECDRVQAKLKASEPEKGELNE